MAGVPGTRCRWRSVSRVAGPEQRKPGSDLGRRVREAGDCSDPGGLHAAHPRGGGAWFLDANANPPGSPIDGPGWHPRLHWIRRQRLGNVAESGLDAAGDVRCHSRSRGPGALLPPCGVVEEGGLAYAAVTRTGDEARSELFLKPGLDKRAQLIARNEEHFVIYLYASPNACLGSPNCSSLGYLIEEANGVGLHLVSLRLDGAQSARDLLVAVGRPFYFSWSPNGDEIIWHTGGALRDDPSAELTLYNIEEDRRILLPFAPGNYQSPAWSPRDRAWLHVIDANGMEQLAHSTSEAATNLVSTAGHGAAFVWSPDGKSVAYASRPRPDAAFYGPISVLDMQSRESHRLTDDAFNVLGFFWSPDGSKLAYLSRLDLPDAIWMQWRVFDTVDGQDRGFTAFHPSPLMRFLVHSFDQYAQSHRFWSPDSRYLVYADRDDRGTDHVKLIDVGGMKDADPIVAADGSIGIWSWQ